MALENNGQQAYAALSVIRSYNSQATQINREGGLTRTEQQNIIEAERTLEKAINDGLLLARGYNELKKENDELKKKLESQAAADKSEDLKPETSDSQNSQSAGGKGFSKHVKTESGPVPPKDEDKTKK